MSLTDEQLKVLLIRSGLIDEDGWNRVADFAQKSQISLQEALIQKGIVADQQLGALIAGALQIPFVQLAGLEIPEQTLLLLPEKIAKKYKAVVFYRGQEGIKIAFNDADATLISDLLAKKTGQQVFRFYATLRDIRNILKLYKKDLQQGFDRLLTEDTQTFSQENIDPPIEKILNLLIESAFQQEASDIHIEPKDNRALVRFRIDGILHDVLVAPLLLHDRLISRIKILSGLRTDEHLSAQDGKIHMDIYDEDLDLRVSIIPITEGEKVVMRLLTSRAKAFSLTDLGISEVDLKKITRAFSKAHGMILATGPTGCGKTTTIYSILKILNVREKNITSIEDPVEYKIMGANQVQVNTKTNLTFANGLRSLLRQDPDHLFVGEIRDGETAGIAVNAAMTGHLVLSTLHTNDTATTFPRLIDMNIEPFLIASTVNLVIAQRLVRKICAECRTTFAITREELAAHFTQASLDRYIPGQSPVTLAKGQGCNACHFTGYSGRIGIFEILEVVGPIRELIREKKDADMIAKAAQAGGMKLMFEDGLEKIAAGTTSLEEVLRVTTIDRE